MAAYEAALTLRPDWVEAAENRDRVLALIPPPPEEEDGGEAPDPTFKADQVEFDEKGKQGKRGEVPETAFTEDQTAEMWMRRLQSDPGAYLRTRFALEAIQEDAP